MNTSHGFGRMVLAATLTLSIAAGGTVAALIAADDPEPVRTPTTAGAVSDAAALGTPAQAAAARARLASYTGGGAGATALASTESASLGGAALADGQAGDRLAVGAMPIECGIGGPVEPYVPTAEEIAAANTDVDALAAVFDQAGITYTRLVDDLGFASLEYDIDNVVVQAVVDSFWMQRYPPQPLPQEEIDRVRAENDAIAAALDAAGIAYVRHSEDDGYEWLEFDAADPAVMDVVNQVYAELYPPQPLPQEEIDRVRAENDGLAAALDAAGITYTRMADETGFEWLEWDYEDPAAQQVVSDYYAVLYPPIDCPVVDPIVCTDVVPLPAEAPAGGGDAVVDGGALVEGSGTVTGVTGEVTTTQVTTQVAVEGCVSPEPYVPTAEELAANAAETDGLAAAFDAAGIAYTRITDDLGFQSLEYDYADAAAQQVAEAYYQTLYGPSPEAVAERDAAVAAMVAAFDAAGVTYEVVGESPYQSVTFDLANPAALPALASLL